MQQSLKIDGGNMSKQMAVLGCGALGSSMGADLTRAGHDVVLIDQWPEHVVAMKRNGLHVSMPDMEIQTPVKSIHLCELCAMHVQFDVVFLVVKSYDTCWMVHFIKPYLKADGVVVSIQNGLNDEEIIPIVGMERDIASAVELSAELFNPGHVKRNTGHDHTWFAIGRLDGEVTPRLREVQQIMQSVGTVEISMTIWGGKWTKLILNTMTSGMSGIMGVKGGELVRTPALYNIMMELGRETARVASALGIKLEPLMGLSRADIAVSIDVLLEKSLAKLISQIGKGTGSRSMVLQDHLKGRPSEIEYINGLIVRKGKELKIPTPWNEAVTSITREIEQGLRKPSLSNLAALEQCWREAAKAIHP
jgi:2-dehydropantoate 2-reductase